MKRLSIALAVLGLTTGALAALPAATDPTLVAVPQLPGGFVIGGTAYYLEPSASHGDLDYAVVNSGTTSPFGAVTHSVEPGYDWAWGANIGYIFPNTGNDINLSYFHFSNDDTSSINLPTVAPFLANLTPIFVIGLGGIIGDIDLTSARAKAEYDLDQVDLTAGQFIDVGCRLILHPNVGVRWASLERKLNTTLAGPSGTGVATTPFALVNIAEKSDFSGVGPLAGIDASYYLGLGFGAVAHFDSALLIGDIDARTNLNTSSGGAAPDFFAFTFKADNNRRIVPVMDGKLGLDYTYVFNNAANSDLTLEAGWQVSHYFNAIDRVSVSGGAEGGFIVGKSTSDLGLQGPYVSLILHV